MGVKKALEIMEKEKYQNLILYGYKASGKTYFGKLLAQKLEINFIDTDLLIENLYEKEFQNKLSCREISQKLGEGGFRHLEEKVIKNLKNISHAVIALGGGTVLNKKNCLILKDLGKLIYLQADKETIKNRIFKEGIPSFLDPKDPITSFEKMYEKRKSIYENLDSIRLRLSGRTNSSILQELILLASQST